MQAAAHDSANPLAHLPTHTHSRPACSQPHSLAPLRLVWSRIWAVLSEYFIAVGCHQNLAVAM